MIRIAFYSHDTFGLGHTRRVAKLANGIISKFPEARCLIITGLDSAGLIPLSPGIDFVRMPGVTKIAMEKYQARNLRIPTQDISAIRTNVLHAAVDGFSPHLFVVDNVPLGLEGEARSLLEKLKSRSKSVPAVLLMRDVLDSPRHINKTWAERGDYEALCDLYECILIFGDPRIYEPVKAYAFPDAVRKKTFYCGILGSSGRRKWGIPHKKGMPENTRPVITVTAGGGEDGFPLVRNYLESTQNCSFLKNFQHLVLLGPYMPKPKKIALFRTYGNLSNIFIHDFIPDIENWIRSSDLVVSMAGYNTVYEVLSLNVPSLVIPRIHPRREQLIRSELLAEFGFLEMIHPAALTPEELCRRIKGCLSKRKRKNRFKLDFKGIEKAVSYIKELLPESCFEGTRGQK